MIACRNIRKTTRKRLAGCCFYVPLLICFALFTGNAIAQNNINFTNISSIDGLSSNTVTAILKDRCGLMWFATEDGLCKFDGSRFSVYRSKPDDSTSLQANEILSLYEDRAGNMWIGTGGGSLALYNRKLDNFYNFPAGANTNGLNNNVIKKICEDSKGNMWVATYAGVNIINPATKKVLPLLLKDRKPFRTPSICIFTDSRKHIWIGTSEGLYVIDEATNTYKRFTSDAANPRSIDNNVIKYIIEDKRGDIWVGTITGLNKMDKNSGQFTRFRHKDNTPNTISGGEINTLAVDDSGMVWVGTGTGLDIIDPATSSIQNFSHNPRNVQGLSSRSILSMYMDNQGICWLGTVRGGINKFDKNLTLFNLVKSNPYDMKALPSPLVTGFAEAPAGKVFVGTEQGGLAIFDPVNRSFDRVTNLPHRNSPENNLDVTYLKMSRSKKLLISTFGYGVIAMDPVTKAYTQAAKIPGSNPASNDVYVAIDDRQGNIWAGTNGDGIIVYNDKLQVVKRFTPNPQFFNDRHLPFNGYIRELMEDDAGDIWIATHGGGLAYLNQQTGAFTVYNTQNSNLPSDKVQALLQDSNGNIWAGTFGGGFAQLNKSTGKFTVYGEKDGLANNNVYKIVEVPGKKFWLSTNKGLSYFDLTTKVFSNYNNHNGLQNGRFVRGAGYRTSNGELYFGGIDGFNYFDPNQLRKNYKAPSVLFTDLKISNQSVAPSEDGPIAENITIAKTIELKFKQNFALSFVALNFSAPEQNQYAYKLEGFDKDWTNIGNTNTVSYSSLSPGEYTFRVRASNNDGVWNPEGNAIKIIVHPPFWRTTFAYLVYLLVFIGAVLYLRHKGFKKMQRKFSEEQEKMKIEEQRREAARIHELDLQKIKFLTNLSHEFRTPISLILGPIDTLIRQQQNDQNFSQLHIIKRNSRRLLNMVNQLLDFRKMEEHELLVHMECGELVSFARDVSDSFRDLAERKKIDFRFSSCIPQLHTSFDHDKLERVLFNLLSNAFKFTLEGGSIRLEIENVSKQSGNSSSWVTFKVSDTGVGIPEDKKEKIFEHFFQANTNPSILNQGTGIGLSITREFVKLLGGQIDVDSKPGKGTSFHVRLPFESVDEHEYVADDAATTTATSEESSTKKEDSKATDNSPSVLLVEDNDDYRDYLKDILRTQYKVLEATNGKEGWQKALAQHPQLVVSDVSMPYMDGIELCKKIKADKRTQHIPVILLTALTGENEQLRGLGIGASDFISKPFNADILNIKIKNLLDLNNTLKNAYSKQIKVLTPEPELESEDEKLMNEITLYLEENMTDTQLSVETLSRHVGMSRSSLYSKLLELTGQTPVEYIRSFKLDKALVLLEKSDMSIAQIAYSVGFATPNYFAKSFKEKFGILPSKFVSQKKGNGHHSDAQHEA